jgi:tRNA(Ile)-lysidine synthase
MNLVVKVARTITHYEMFAQGDRVAVGVSGGADSVCLLEVLGELAAEWNLRLSVVHVNHHLRGAESDGDAEFVRALAAKRGLGFTGCDLDLTGAGSLEQAARVGRLGFFHGLVERGDADRVAQGHTRNDQAETVLFRLLRGSGAAGLAAIRPVTEHGIVRPLIEVERAEVEAYLRERGIAWREDASNASPEFDRNRIRRQLLPQLAREWNPAIVETLARTAELALGEESYWRTEVARLGEMHLKSRDGAVLAPTVVLANLPVAAGRRLVRRAIEIAKGNLRGIAFGHVAEVLELAARERGSGRVHLPGLEVRRSFDWLRFGKGPGAPPYCAQLDVPGVTKVPNGKCSISLEIVEKLETMGLTDNVYTSGMGCLDWALLSGPLEVRNWRPGDQYRPMGNSGVLKIKTLFQQARVPVWERAQWPVVTSESTIVWTRRFGPAAALAAHSGSSPVLTIREMESARGQAASIEVACADAPSSTEIL